MRALVVEEINGPLIHKEVDIPRPGPGKVLRRVMACAVDQFDLKIRYGLVPHAKPPIILGHEIAGEIAGVGEGVTDWQVGQRVTSTLLPHLWQMPQMSHRPGNDLRKLHRLCWHPDTGRVCGVHRGAGENLVELPPSICFAEGSVLANAVADPPRWISPR